MRELSYSNDAEWRAIRAAHIGSSESAALAGLTTWTTPFALYHAKRGALHCEAPENNRMDAGKRLEGAISAWAADVGGYDLLKSQVYCVGDVPRMGATIDNFIVAKDDPGRGPGILEVKNRDWLQWKEHWTDTRPPADIVWQVQHQFRCTGFTWGEIACLVGGNELRRYPVVPLDRAMTAIGEAVTDFWSAVDNNLEPPVEGYPCEIEVLKGLYAEIVADKMIELDDVELAETVRMWDWASKQRLTLEKTEESCKAKVMQKIGDAQVLTAPTVRVRQSFTKSNARRFKIDVGLPEVATAAKRSTLEAG